MDDLKFIEKIEIEIERLKGKGKRFWFDFNITSRQLEIIKSHLDLNVYRIETRQCQTCSKGVWDVTISW